MHFDSHGDIVQRSLKPKIPEIPKYGYTPKHHTAMNRNTQSDSNVSTSGWTKVAGHKRPSFNPAREMPPAFCFIGCIESTGMSTMNPCRPERWRWRGPARGQGRRQDRCQDARNVSLIWVPMRWVRRLQKLSKLCAEGTYTFCMYSSIIVLKLYPFLKVQLKTHHF